jgi:tyrosyl-tRNA synthetase
LEKSKMVGSRGEGRRLIGQKAVSINQLPIANLQFPIKDLKSGEVIKIGKRKWIKLI